MGSEYGEVPLEKPPKPKKRFATLTDVRVRVFLIETPIECAQGGLFINLP